LILRGFGVRSKKERRGIGVKSKKAERGLGGEYMEEQRIRKSNKDQILSIFITWEMAR